MSKYVNLNWLKKVVTIKKTRQQNMFVVTTISQLRIIVSFILLNQCKDNVLVILYTEKNLKMPLNIMGNIPLRFFRDVQLLKIPNSPNDIDESKYLFFGNTYKKLLEYFCVKKLYVFSFLRHYSILLSIAKKLKIHTCLLEEGTATYLPLMDDFSCNISIIEKVKLKKYLNEKNCFKLFDSTYSTFPYLLEKAFCSAKNSFFFPHVAGVSVTKEVRNIASKYSITSNDYVYVSQRFVKDKNLYNAVENIVGDIAKNINGKIFIKLHPVEMMDRDICLFYEKLSLRYKNIDFIKESVLVEPFLYLTNPKGIIGITSTSLIYTQIMGFPTFSIVPMLLKNQDISEQNREMIAFHYDIMTTVSNAVQDVVAISDILDYRQQIIYCVDEMYLKKAHTNYKKKRYHYSVFFYELCCSRCFRLLDAHHLLYYLVSLKYLKQYDRMKEFLFLLLETNIDGLSVYDRKVFFDLKDKKT